MGWSNTAGAVLQATTVIISGPGSQIGIFVYSGAPAAGNLVGAWTAQPGTDPFGNPFPGGFAIFDAGEVLIGRWNTAGLSVINDPGSGQLQIVSQAVPAVSPLLELIGTPGVSATPANLLAMAGGGTEQAQINGPTTGGVTDPAASYIYQAFFGASALNNATWVLFWNDGAGARFGMITAGPLGAGLTGLLTAVKPGTSGPTLAAETWHTLALNAGFAALGAPFGTPRYQLEGVGAGRTRLDGVLTLTANQAQGTVIATLPTGYRPTGTRIFLTPNNLSGGAGQVESLDVDAAGNLTLGHAGSTGNYLSLDGVTVPVD